MTYAEAIQFLYGLQLFGANFGLETPRQLAALAGNPHEKLRFIHVAGTNGKGSTCAMLESIYRAAGLRVGLYTSPHLVSFRERIQVNRQLIPENEVAHLAARIQESLKTFPADQHPTFFEVVTVLALEYFAEQKCDLVIWETGLGGRLDATNIVTPLASVITNIQFDHQQWLGDTLAKIAAEKAGIIKPGVPVLTAAIETEVLAVFEQTARARKSPLTRIKAPHASDRAPHASLLGDHQQLNAALAVATVEALQDKIPVSETAIRAGLSTVQWPGRLQLVTRPGGQRVLLDAAHNPAGADILTAALRKYFPTVRPTLVLGILRDKDWPAMCARLAPLAARIFTIAVGSARTATAAELAEACRAAHPAAEVMACDSFAEAAKHLTGDSFVVITGSLYLIGEALESLGLSTTAGSSERALNEWGGAKSAAR